MASGESAYLIASRIFARFVNFPEHFIVKIYLCFKQSIHFRWNVCGFRSVHGLVFDLRKPVHLKISIIGKYPARGFRFYITCIEHTLLQAGIHLYHNSISKDISCFTGCYFYMYSLSKYGITWWHAHDIFANLGHFQGIIICLHDNKRQ